MVGLHGAPRGRLTLTAPALFATRVVTPIITEYLQRYPSATPALPRGQRVVDASRKAREFLDLAIQRLRAHSALS